MQFEAKSQQGFQQTCGIKHVTARKSSFSWHSVNQVSSLSMMIKRRMVAAVAIVLLIQSSGLMLCISNENSEISNGYAAFAKRGRKGKYTESPAEEHFASGKAKLSAEDLDGAIDAFLQATYFARNAYYPEAYYWLGIAYMDKGGQDNKAVEALEKNVAQSVEEPTDTYLALAQIHLRNNRWDECEKAVRSIHKYDKKTNQKIEYIYGLMEDKKAENVVEDTRDSFSGLRGTKGYEKGREMEKKMAKEAAESERRGHWQSAEGHYENALGEKPWTWTAVWLKYCEDKMKLQKWAEALRELLALKNTTSVGNVLRTPLSHMHKDIGFCELALGNHQGAMDDWRRALDYNKNDYEVWLQIGMLLETEHHYSSAIKYYKEFLRLREGSNDPRIQQVRDRITKLEHMLNPNEAAPQRPKPSPYMREEMNDYGNRENRFKDQQRRQKQIQQQREGDSGF